MLTYTHKVHYYETDKMGITHHSNYVRWMEEARFAYLEEIGLSFKSIEEMGYVSPVVSIDVNYVRPTTFDDVLIETRLSEYNGIVIEVSYIMKNTADESIVAKAKSKHCFLKGNEIVPLKKRNPKMDMIFGSVLERD